MVLVRQANLQVTLSKRNQESKRARHLKNKLTYSVEHYKPYGTMYNKQEPLNMTTQLGGVSDACILCMYYVIFIKKYTVIRFLFFFFVVMTANLSYQTNNELQRNIFYR